MVARVHLLLAVACVAVLNGQALGQSHCTTVSWGNLLSTPHPISTAILNPEIRDWNVNIPVPPECAYTPVSGVSVTSCDYDKIPQSKFVDKLVVFLHRNGRLHQEATATATVFCNPYASETKDVASTWEDNSWQHKGPAVVAVPN